MKKTLLIITSMFLIGTTLAMAEVYQTVQGENAYLGDGRSANEAGKLDVKEVGGSTAARVKSNFARWGYINYWMGIPTPAGPSTIRFRVYKSSEPTAEYKVYIQTQSGHAYIGDFVVPEVAAEGNYVDVDLPVSQDGEWSGIVLKKASKDELPSPWIDTVCVLVDE
ncbi:hypothetical protein [Cerasicoccus frondis]|uniref:hypothetical protein n=1 Tax=Cerasicoccus frondis TaxID=490090 RepID=UPI002852C55E|nr:hypothetical protein [Cerasicoccus frondis]